MRTDIFIRSYKNDFPWLRYCLRSIKKFASNFSIGHIVVPFEDAQKLQNDVPESFGFQIHGIKQDFDGYLHQQYTKMIADRFCDSDYVLHMDSDTILTTPSTPLDFMQNGKPIILYTDYNLLIPGHPALEEWRRATSDALGETVHNEYMRRHPLMYHRSTYLGCRKFMEEKHRMPLEAFIKSRPNRSFTEFNVLGAYCNKYEKDKYVWVNTQDGFSPDRVLQKWSWGGLTDVIKQELEEKLK